MADEGGAASMDSKEVAHTTAASNNSFALDSASFRFAIASLGVTAVLFSNCPSNKLISTNNLLSEQPLRFRCSAKVGSGLRANPKNGEKKQSSSTTDVNTTRLSAAVMLSLSLGRSVFAVWR